MIGVKADDRLQNRRHQLERERDETDLAEAQMVGSLENRVSSRNHRLHSVIEQVTKADRRKDAEGGLSLCGCGKRPRCYGHNSSVAVAVPIGLPKKIRRGE